MPMNLGGTIIFWDTLCLHPVYCFF